MTLTLYNTLARKKELFKPRKKQVSLYTCGPTVYNYAHIGNLRSYIFEDVLKRTLLFNHYKVKHVMNITDVGHLSSDADSGEDKMLKGARREKKTVWEVADFYTKAFQDDIQKLNILSPDIWCKATEHIKEQIDLIKKLEKNGFTYASGGNIYFDTSKLEDYGKLFNLKSNTSTKGRIKKDKNKKNPHDFVLWFTKSKFQKQEMKWNSPFNLGYPGWHIECSAMASKYLGKQFDIHCGGIDHIPIHHTNEIAQAEAAFGKKPWVRYWLHNEFLVLPQGKKMSKSKENFLTLFSLTEQNLHPLDYRYFCLGTHYRKPLMFSEEALLGAHNSRKKLLNIFFSLKETRRTKKESKSKQKTYFQKFTKQINDDLNTPKALATLWGVIKDKKLTDKDKYFLLIKFDEVLGLNLKNTKKATIPKEIIKLAKERLQARNGKNWSKSDQLRDRINQLGYSIADTKEGYEIDKV